MKHDLMEFVVSIIAVLLGLIAGKYIAVQLAAAKVPISAGDPIVVALPGKAGTNG